MDRPPLRLTGQEDPGQIDVDDSLPLGQRHLLGRCGIGDAGAVHRQRQRTELGFCPPHGLGQGRWIGDVGRDRD
jgi:hypothetical protein